MLRGGPFFAHLLPMNRLNPTRFSRLIALLAALPALASAHPGHDLTWDFSGGFGHPIGGLDHVLAMVAVGLWAAQLGGRARWLVPSAFVGLLAVGAAFGHLGMAPAGVEQMIAASLLVLGLMVVIAQRLPLAVGLGLTALFGAFHGFAHGAEIPGSSGGISYGLGFITATVLLHGAGLALGLLSARQSAWFTRIAGAGVAACGAVLLLR
jgi:urease accessory protein